MAQTFTSTAYSATPRSVHNGVFTISFDYTTPAAVSLSASANSTVVFGPRIPNKTWILAVSGNQSSGSATNPVDIGYDATISAFASQKAATTVFAAGTSLPFFVSLSDDAATQFITTKWGLTPGTDTAVANVKGTIWCTRDI